MHNISPLILAFAAAMITTVACERVDTPIPKPTVVEGNDSIAFPKVDSASMNREYKKTYVEEYTGHKCITCPANTELLIQQYNDNKDRMIVVSVHAGSFAAVDLPYYPTDFNTDYGTELFLHYDMGTQPIPSAIINRKSFPSYNDMMVFNQATTFWSGPIDEENTNTDTDFAIGLAADYIDSLDLFYITVSTEVLNTVNGNYRLLVLCTEDSVVAEQLDGRVKESEYPKKIVPDYVHRHVLRGKLSTNLSLSGDPLIEGVADAGTWYHYELNATMPEKVVSASHTYVVALVINADTEEVVQSEEVHTHVL